MPNPLKELIRLLEGLLAEIDLMASFSGFLAESKSNKLLEQTQQTFKKPNWWEADQLTVLQLQLTS